MDNEKYGYKIYETGSTYASASQLALAQQFH